MTSASKPWYWRSSSVKSRPRPWLQTIVPPRRVALEDGDLMPGQQEVVGSGHAGRAGADHGSAAAGRGLLLERDGRIEVVVEHRLDDHVPGVAVRVADGDR